jgi:hypothetical protein
MATLAQLALIADALALWVSLYVTAVFICFWHIAAGGAPPAAGVVAAATIAGATYLLDRAKLSDRRLDPADLAAHPARAAFVRRRRRAIRAAILGLAAVGAVSAATLHPAAAALAPLALLGVTLYAGRPPLPGRPRVKDRLILKNLAVGASLAGLGATLAFATDHELNLGACAIAFAFACALATADAILCDLDDAASDARFGTRTLPGALGRRSAVAMALGLHAVAGAVLLAFLPLLADPAPAGVWAIGAPATAGAVVFIRGGRTVRTLIDARLPGLAAIAMYAATM